MRSIFAFLLAILLPPNTLAQQTPATTAAPPTPTGAKAVLSDATPVKRRLSRNVSSADAHTGDTVDFEVLEEIKVGDVVAIPKGGIAWGTVTEVESKKRMARGGKLQMATDSVRLGDGEKAALRGVREVKGGGHTGAMTGGIVASAILILPAAPFFLFMHGKDITIPKGTEITAYTNGTMPLDLAKFAPSPGQTNAAQPATNTAQPAANQAILEVSSTPPGADIEIDGSFVGNTPSSVAVAPGVVLPARSRIVRPSIRCCAAWAFRTCRTSPPWQPSPSAT